MSGGRDVRAGSRRRRVVVGVAVSSLALVGTAVSAHASSPAEQSGQCEVETLELPGDLSDVSVVGADPTGRYIVGSGRRANESEAHLLWTDGAVQELSGPSYNDDYAIWLEAVNSSGVVVGNTQVGNDSIDPWSYEAGSYTDLRNETAGDWAVDINVDGDVVGFGWNGTTGEIPMVWPADDYANPQEIPSPAGVVVRAISDSGAIIGYEEAGDGQSYPYYWADATSEGERLELPAGVESASALDIAGDWAVGSFDQGGIRWNLRDGSVEPLPGKATLVNSAGDAGGVGGKIYRADGSTVELPLPDGETGSVDVAAVFDRDADSAAAGTFEDEAGNTRPVVWTC